jgi:hypothetical protein
VEFYSDSKIFGKNRWSPLRESEDKIKYLKDSNVWQYIELGWKALVKGAINMRKQ